MRPSDLQAAAMLARVWQQTYLDIMALPVTYACPPEELR